MLGWFKKKNKEKPESVPVEELVIAEDISTDSEIEKEDSLTAHDEIITVDPVKEPVSDINIDELKSLAVHVKAFNA